MSLLIHNALFKPNDSTISNLNNQELIQYMSSYMLFSKNKIQTNKEIIISDDKIEENINAVKQESQKMVEPKQKDTLFWCLYIILNGIQEYEILNRNYIMCEMEWKQKLSGEISKNQALIKNSNHKMTKAAVQEVISDLLTNVQKTNIGCLIAITVYRNINIILMTHTKKTRMEYLSGNNSNKTYLIIKNENNKYSLQYDSLTESELIDIRNNTLLIENENKVMKSIGSYKVDDLINIAKLLEIYNHNEKYKKNELYALICENITSFSI